MVRCRLGLRAGSRGIRHRKAPVVVVVSQLPRTMASLLLSVGIRAELHRNLTVHGWADAHMRQLLLLSLSLMYFAVGADGKKVGKLAAGQWLEDLLERDAERLRM